MTHISPCGASPSGTANTLDSTSRSEPETAGFPMKPSGAPALRAIVGNEAARPFHIENDDSLLQRTAHNNPHLKYDPEVHDQVHAQERPNRNLQRVVTSLERERPKESAAEESHHVQCEQKSKKKRFQAVEWFSKLKEKFQGKKKRTIPLKRSKTESDASKKQPSESNPGHVESSQPKWSRHLSLDRKKSPIDPELPQNGFLKRLSIGSFSLMMGPDDPEIEQLEAESRRKLMEYKFIDIIGAGAQGTVTLRCHIPTSTQCALKSIPTAPSLVDSHVRQSFYREVEILRACRSHASIIHLRDSWESKHVVYQVFDIMTGGDASAPGVFHGITEEKAVRLISPIADALRFLHEKGICHRDLRPANVFLRRPLTRNEPLLGLETIPVLSDFGIATYIQNSGRLAIPFRNTPVHLAPELMLDARFTTASDCYGLGIYAVQVVLHRAPDMKEVRCPDEISDTLWRKLTEVAKSTLKGLVDVEPMDRMTAAEFCGGEWVKACDVDEVPFGKPNMQPPLPTEVVRQIALNLSLGDVANIAMASKSTFTSVIMHDPSFARQHLAALSRHHKTFWHLLDAHGIKGTSWLAIPFTYKVAILASVFGSESLDPEEQKLSIKPHHPPQDLDISNIVIEDISDSGSDWEDENELETVEAEVQKKGGDSDLDDWERWRVSPAMAVRIYHELLHTRAFNIAVQKNAPFVVACAMGYTQVVTELLQNPQVNPADDENSALFYAASEGKEEIVQLLLQDGRVSAGAFGNQPLMVAMEEGKKSVVQLLLADANVRRHLDRDQQGFCLYWAACHNFVEFVHGFLEHGSIEDIYCLRAQKGAEERGHREVSEILSGWLRTNKK
ncbi:hypothetical protein HDU98_012243 [Podochytrium sp. JEL0797]|nr:hypothetical protein HDU98_012243 [Podochytrium sp. JEL0797]